MKYKPDTHPSFAVDGSLRPRASDRSIALVRHGRGSSRSRKSGRPAERLAVHAKRAGSR